MDRKGKYARFAIVTVLVISLQQNCAKKDSEFLETHFSESISLQGNPPSGFSNLEKSLDPNSCGTCHPTQWNRWKDSFHAKAVGSGILWELPRLTLAESQKCLRCHSVLPETKEYIVEQVGHPANLSQTWAAYIPKGVETNGVFCASCHVRNHVRFGPPKILENSNVAISEVSSEKASLKPHNGFQVRKEYESSEFCKSCHESPDSGKRTNGKKYMETYSEWKESVFSRDTITCQNCHMPNRLHEWKGIHDSEFTKKGIEVDFQIVSETETQLSIHSKNIGHKFPTYLVPQIFVKVYSEKKGQPRKSLLQERIGRYFDLDLQVEEFDTRIHPKEKRIYKVPINKKELQNSKIVVELFIQPDEYYIRRFVANLQNRERFQISDFSKKHLEQSLQEKKKSEYSLFYEFQF